MFQYKEREAVPQTASKASRFSEKEEVTEDGELDWRRMFGGLFGGSLAAGHSRFAEVEEEDQLGEDNQLEDEDLMEGLSEDQWSWVTRWLAA